MKAVLATYSVTDEYLADLKNTFPQVTFTTAETEEEQKREIPDADIFFGIITPELFAEEKKLRWVQWPGTGIDKIMDDTDLINSDVVLVNCRGPHTAPMADHTFSVILALTHNARELWADQKAHEWDTWKYDHRMLELGGQTMGILALGGIGSAIAKRAGAFDMNVIGVDIQEMEPPPGVNEVWGVDRLDELMGISDWFVVAAPFTRETENVIDRRRIGLLKPGAFLIAMSRGGIVDEEALIDGLKSGRIAGAGLDVFSKEPLPGDSPLWDMENVIISPHSSAMSIEMEEGRRQIFKENLRRYLNNEPFLYVCDKRAGY